MDMAMKDRLARHRADIDADVEALDGSIQPRDIRL
jgi:hypothetical protein